MPSRRFPPETDAAHQRPTTDSLYYSGFGKLEKVLKVFLLILSVQSRVYDDMVANGSWPERPY